jgi:hypothetical protein
MTATVDSMVCVDGPMEEAAELRLLPSWMVCLRLRGGARLAPAGTAGGRCPPDSATSPGARSRQASPFRPGSNAARLVDRQWEFRDGKLGVVWRGERSAINDSKPWFRFAAESAAPRRVHLAKATIVSKGKDGWSNPIRCSAYGDAGLLSCPCTRRSTMRDDEAERLPVALPVQRGIERNHAGNACRSLPRLTQSNRPKSTTNSATRSNIQSDQTKEFFFLALTDAVESAINISDFQHLDRTEDPA